MIRQNTVELALPGHRATGVQFRLQPAAVGAYAILVLLGLIYFVPLLFVLSVSLMSTRLGWTKQSYARWLHDAVSQLLFAPR